MAFLIGLLAIELLAIGSLLIILSSINQRADKTVVVFYFLSLGLSAYFFKNIISKGNQLLQNAKSDAKKQI
ncbi:hypothetical protein GCM10010099_16330 [Streptomyces cinereus]|nr:hypothetical protein GCM10010099_16330 [Streptomyces cinereus]